MYPNQNYLDVLPKKNTTPFVKAELEYFGIESITRITNVYYVNDESHILHGITVYFEVSSKELVYEIAKKLQKTEFGAVVSHDVMYLE